MMACNAGGDNALVEVGEVFGAEETTDELGAAPSGLGEIGAVGIDVSTRMLVKLGDSVEGIYPSWYCFLSSRLGEAVGRLEERDFVDDGRDDFFVGCILI
jgi:hypothetical protein